MKKIFKLVFPAILILTLLLPGSVFAKDKSLIVGGKDYTEQLLLPELAGILLEQAGFDVTLKTGVGSVIARKSLENAQFDLYYEYTGTAYTLYYKQKDTEIMTVPEKVYDWVKQADSEKDLVWLDPVRFNNTYSLMMNKAEAEKLEIKSISDLGVYVTKNPDKLIFALDSEFWERPDGFKGIMKRYNFRLPSNQVKKMSVGLTYQALKDGLVNSAMGFTTDGRIAAFGFVNLEDDKSFFPVYNPVPVVRKEILDTYPEIPAILKPLAENLTSEVMQQLNMAVDIDHKPVHDVAMDWLKSKNLIK
ncbi:ABC-type glycine betaine/proline transport system, periplasmic glycine betaine/proline-binding protein [Desulforapulum autotrophicum HRM2]|uniref:ABC-type glycine betaine/proline transport system, periplasmic glycine betaine/proline-binding protein n=1 Tax=Desulforapulum autotrophicum (strain ATCC 43914 / DSM 3382 / VKM B-1955 / HRM2) TaxID=177437 RepID=C0QK23_DESAH|nr:glycine betaine ABC transporter substrate-binding protein [Desulforapulum autotrophicum]ACN16049.1 ABC-type glycine betaine/proline transport system, periplasmic glycine betaine/proline-binding protein [Desulforapulum autotrophicum HRM2]